MINDPEVSKRPLRIGLLVDSLTQPRWVSKIINDIQASDFAEICLVVKNEATSEPLGRFQSYWKNRKYLLYAFYNRIDDRISLAEDDAFADVDVKELLADVPVLGVMPVMKKFSDWFPDEAVEKIRSYDLDVAISHGFRILRGEARTGRLAHLIRPRPVEADVFRIPSPRALMPRRGGGCRGRRAAAGSHARVHQRALH